MAQKSFLENDNPVDFLYLDRQRIASLIGQLSDKGQLTGLKSMASKTLQKEGGADASIGIAKLEGKRATTSGESVEETWDPFWTNAYSFLKDIEENFAMPLPDSRLGSMVSFEAFIQLVDLRMMKNLWEPSIQAFVNSQKPVQASTTRSSRKQRREQPSEQKLSPDNKIALQILKEIPHLLHMTFLTKSNETIYRLWASIKPDFLNINSEDLAMKYGAAIDGQWRVVGILDAMIGEPSVPVPVNPMIDAVMNSLAFIREQVGRPRTHFGLTPIAIYAPIRGAVESEAEQPACTP
jgi:hypothetical protein